MGKESSGGKILVLGAGRVARPCVSYLCEKGYDVSVADLSRENLDKIKKSCAGIKTRVMEFSGDFKSIFSEIEADLVICLLPPSFCEPVMKACVESGAHMIHPSYVDGGQKKLDGAIREAGRIVIGEMGLDPGIDHMSAARGASEAKRDGFTVESYRSSCGALPAVEANTNPWGYKLSWAPESLIGTFLRPAKGLLNGNVYDFPGGKAFKNVELLDVPGLSSFELYPNGDALPYRELYSIPEVKTLYRGTLRYVGWSETIGVMNDIGLTDHEKTDTKGKSFAQFVAGKIGVPAENVRDGFCEKTGVRKNSGVFLRMEWLGFFSDSVIPLDSAGGADVIALLFGEKLRFGPGERDLVVLVDEMVQLDKKSGRRRKLCSSLIDFGIPGGDSSISRTTGLPQAIAAHLILSGVIRTPGLHIPVTEEIYRPVLAELGNTGIKLEEKILPSADVV